MFAKLMLAGAAPVCAFGVLLSSCCVAVFGCCTTGTAVIVTALNSELFVLLSGADLCVTFMKC